MSNDDGGWGIHFIISSRFLHNMAAATRPLPIEIALKTDLIGDIPTAIFYYHNKGPIGGGLSLVFRFN